MAASRPLGYKGHKVITPTGNGSLAISATVTLSFIALISNEWTFCGTSVASLASPQPRSAIISLLQ